MNAKDTFSLRDETGTCPNIEVETAFFIRPYHAKEEHKMPWTKK